MTYPGDRTAFVTIRDVVDVVSNVVITDELTVLSGGGNIYAVLGVIALGHGEYWATVVPR